MSLSKEFSHADAMSMLAPHDGVIGGAVFERKPMVYPIPQEAFVKIVNPDKPRPSDRLLNTLVGAVDRLDDWALINLNKLTEGENPLYTPIFSAEEISDLQDQYSRRLKQVAESHPYANPVIACPMMGSWGIMDWQIRNGMSTDQVVAVEINGSSGVDTGTAEVRTNFPSQVLDQNRYVIVADDVGDSFVSMLHVAGERMRNRLKIKKTELTDVEKVIGEIKELKNIVKSEKPDDPDVWKDPRFGKLYKKAVSYLRSEHVIVAPFISKNKQFLQILREEFETHGREEWSHIQHEMLKNQIEMNAKMWITGGAGDGVWRGVRLFDIGKKLSDIWEYIPEELQKRIHEERCADNVLVRLIARIPELLGLNGGIEGEKKLMALIGPEFRKILEEGTIKIK